MSHLDHVLKISKLKAFQNGLNTIMVAAEIFNQISAYMLSITKSCFLRTYYEFILRKGD